MPCDDFLPTNFTGNSFVDGPARKAAADTEKSLKRRWLYFLLKTFTIFEQLAHKSS